MLRGARTSAVSRGGIRSTCGTKFNFHAAGTAIAVKVSWHRLAHEFSPQKAYMVETGLNGKRMHMKE